MPRTVAGLSVLFSTSVVWRSRRAGVAPGMPPSIRPLLAPPPGGGAGRIDHRPPEAETVVVPPTSKPDGGGGGGARDDDGQRGGEPTHRNFPVARGFGHRVGRDAVRTHLDNS